MPLPQEHKSSTDNYTKDVDGPMFSLSKYLDQAVDKSRQPKKPLQKSHQHNNAYYSRVGNLVEFCALAQSCHQVSAPIASTHVFDRPIVASLSHFVAIKRR